jgi:catechol 2,3-dioxygenase-like lactoylglutathione lyase family enzyme
MTSEIRFNHVGPQFVAHDVAAAVAFYTEVLGFGVDYLNGEPPEYAVVCRDEVYIHLSREGHPAFASGPGSAFVAVRGVERVWNRVKSAAPQAVLQELDDRDYGQDVRFRVFCLADPSGNILRIGEPLQRRTREQ